VLLVVRLVVSILSSLHSCQFCPGCEESFTFRPSPSRPLFFYPIFSFANSAESSSCRSSSQPLTIPRFTPKLVLLAFSFTLFFCVFLSFFWFFWVIRQAANLAS
jgi:hypothetical protein